MEIIALKEFASLQLRFYHKLIRIHLANQDDL